MLAGTFGALAVLPLVFLTEIGFIVAFGVLLDTFVVRSVIVPALVIDIGEARLVAVAARPSAARTSYTERSRLSVRRHRHTGCGGPRRAAPHPLHPREVDASTAGAALAFACAALLVVPATGSAATGRPKPLWLTSTWCRRSQAAGAQGHERPGEERLNTECPGVQNAGVSAGGLHRRADGLHGELHLRRRLGTQYVGTARHCTDAIGARGHDAGRHRRRSAVVGTVSPR